MTQAEVAKTIGTTQKVIFSRFKQAGYHCRKAAKRHQRGPANSFWKGDAATYAALHYRVAAARGKPKLCAMCDLATAPKYEWANLTGDYTKINDYIRLCIRCHRRLDLAKIDPNLPA